MQIIAGIARGINLSTPPTMDVRPTAGRSRKALFDSLGRFDGTTVVDLCAGSGALGLEAASRGAAEVVLVERDRRHCRHIECNVEAVRKAGVKTVFRVVEGDAMECRHWRGVHPDVIFADPPYAVSCEIWKKVMTDYGFRREGAGALVVWELPDTPGERGAFLLDNPLEESRIRKFGGTEFMIGYLPENADDCQ